MAQLAISDIHIQEPVFHEENRPFDASVDFEKLTEADAELLRQCYYRQSYTDLRMRFCGVLSERALEKYCMTIDWENKIVLGCRVNNILRGAVELAMPKPGEERCGEIAILVEKRFQNRGIGTELLRRAFVLARNRFIFKLTMMCLPENRKMQHLAQKFDSELSAHFGTLEAVSLHNWPTMLSVAEELGWENQKLFRTVFKT